jgi:hypothetical protein
MFGDDEPRNPSPRTTIVGGQPPRPTAALPPVPTGIQRLLRLASVDEAFRRELLARRGGIATAAEVALTPSERAILQAIPAAQLEAMITSLPPPEEDRRSFLRQTAATAVMLLGGAALSACNRDMRSAGGAAPDVPPRRPEVNIMQDEGGAKPDPPPPRPTEGPREMAGATAEPRFAEPPPPRPGDDLRPMAGVTAPRDPPIVQAGATGPIPPPRVDHRLQAPGGAAPDQPPPRPPKPPRDGGTERPPDNRPTRGIRPDVPRK